MFEYAAIDIETTGLVPGDHQVLEVGVVCDRIGDNGGCRFGDVTRIVLIREDFYCSTYCAVLHAKLFAEMRAVMESDEWKQKHGYVYLAEGIIRGDFDLPCDTYYVDMDHEDGYYAANIFREAFRSLIREGHKINVAGKNLSTFDIPHMEEAGLFLTDGESLQFCHRVFDPAVLYFDPDTDGRLPDLATCLERAGMSSDVSHTAIHDALDIVQLIRHKFA